MSNMTLSCRDAMGKALFMCGLMEMEVILMTVVLMALLLVYTPSLLELLVLMVTIVTMMSDVLQKWLWPM